MSYHAAVQHPRPLAHRLTVSLLAVLLLVIGPGCVSWHPIFQGLPWFLTP